VPSERKLRAAIPARRESRDRRANTAIMNSRSALKDRVGRTNKRMSLMGAGKRWIHVVPGV